MEKLKAEIFDVIKEQDILKIKYQQLEQVKQNKLKELEVLENGKENKEV